MTTQLSHNTTPQQPKTTTVFVVAVNPGFTDWHPVPREVNSLMLKVMQSKFDGRMSIYWEPTEESEEHGKVLYYANSSDALHYCRSYFVKLAENANLVLKQIHLLLKV